MDVAVYAHVLFVLHLLSKFELLNKSVVDIVKASGGRDLVSFLGRRRSMGVCDAFNYIYTSIYAVLRSMHILQLSTARDQL